MDIRHWLARCARFIDGLRTRAAGFGHLRHRHARRSLSGRLSPHLLRDIGLGEGGAGEGGADDG